MNTGDARQRPEAAGARDLDWLHTLRDDVARITGEAAVAFWPSPQEDCPAFFNYRLEHVRQVEREALRLLAAVGGDREIVLAGVWLHDRCQPMFRGPPAHGERAAEWAAAHLAGRGFPAGKVDAVCYAVARHSDPPGALPPGAHEARLLWDADKLSHVGVVRLLCAFLNGYLAADRLRTACSDPAFPERALTVESIARTFLERRGDEESPVPRFYFAPSRQWAAERWQLEEACFRALRVEVGIDP